MDLRCLQRLSADDKRLLARKELKVYIYINIHVSRFSWHKGCHDIEKKNQSVLKCLLGCKDQEQQDRSGGICIEAMLGW